MLYANINDTAKVILHLSYKLYIHLASYRYNAHLSTDDHAEITFDYISSAHQFTTRCDILQTMNDVSSETQGKTLRALCGVDAF